MSEVQSYRDEFGMLRCDRTNRSGQPNVATVIAFGTAVSILASRRVFALRPSPKDAILGVYFADADPTT